MSIWDHNQDNYLKRLGNPVSFREKQMMFEFSNPMLTREQKHLALLNNPLAATENEKIEQKRNQRKK